jgi:rhamnosyltransferase subunit B
MLVVPFGQDQPDNARRAVRLGVGRTIARTRYRVDRLMRELSLLGDPAVCDRAHAVGLQIEAERGVENACDELEKALDG